MHPLEEVNIALETIQNVPGKKDKNNLIAKFASNELFQKSVLFALHHEYTYNLKKLPLSQTTMPSSQELIFTTLAAMQEKNGCTHEEAQKLANLAGNNKPVWELLNKIVNKDLRCGVSVKSFRKHISNLPLHEPMLCIDNLDKHLKLVNGDVSKLLYSLKLDGVRVWVKVTDNKVQYLSRTGKEYKNFSCLDEEVLSYVSVLSPFLISKTIILDGEVISVDNDFQKQMTQIRRLENVDDSIFRLSIFDVVEKETPLFLRIQILLDSFNLWKNKKKEKTTKLSIVPHNTAEELGIKNKQDIIAYCNELCNKGEEGIVVKTKLGKYEFKRSNHWCKVKQFHTVDVKVLGWEKGTGRNKNRIGNFICVYKNTEVKVGSGFTDQEREEFMDEPPKLIEVQYQNKTNAGSLRFPTFVRVREDK